MKHKYYNRADRLADLIHKELVGIILKHCQDPRLAHLTITNVTLTLDLSIAKIYFTNFLIDSNNGLNAITPPTRINNNKLKIKQVQQILQHASDFLRCRLAEKMNLRKVPELRFYYDENLEQGLKIESLLSKIMANGSL